MSYLETTYKSLDAHTTKQSPSQATLAMVAYSSAIPAASCLLKAEGVGEAERAHPRKAVPWSAVSPSPSYLCTARGLPMIACPGGRYW